MDGVKIGLIGIVVYAIFSATWLPRLILATKQDIERVKVENDIRAALLVLVAPFVTMLAVIFTIVSFQESNKAAQQQLDLLRQAQMNERQANEERNKAAQEQLDLLRQGQINERYTKAIEQLANDKSDIRLGAVYALERIARESKDLHLPIMYVLANFLRDRAPGKASNSHLREHDFPAELDSLTGHQFKDAWDLPKDHKAILSVFMRRKRDPSHEPKDFVITLPSIQWQGVTLGGADLQGFFLWNANLKHAFLQEANLKATNLMTAKLINANLDKAHMEGADLDRAHMERASLRGAFLDNAILTAAYLQGANFTDAHLAGTHVERANMKGADLRGVDLSRTLGMKQEQIDSAKTDARTLLPPGLSGSKK
jgi:hypothetical protein